MKNETGFKNALFIFIGILIYMAVIFVCELPGYLAPSLWVLSCALAAIPGALILYALCKRWPKFGLYTLTGLLWTLLMAAAGEIWTYWIPCWCMAFALIADLVRKSLSADKKKAQQISYCIFAFMPFGQFIPLWIYPSTYAGMAAAEMGSQEYANGLLSFSNPLSFFGIACMIVVCALLGEYLAAKFFKMK
jgi:putative ECF transporter S component (TIGR02185 family)